jgi:hypothetical protein
MEKEFVTYEQAKELFDLGFRSDFVLRGFMSIYGEIILTDTIYDGKYILEAPLKSQVFRWFREKWELHVEIVVQLGFKHWNVHILPSGEWLKKPTPAGFNTYEEAENAAIDKLIELAKQ